MRRTTSDEMLTSYVLGELDADARAALDALLATDHELAQHVFELRATAAIAESALQAEAEAGVRGAPAPLELLATERKKLIATALAGPKLDAGSGSPKNKGSNMKVICENCGAKYSLDEDKVRGKVFKIRCKKCNEPIMVRGAGAPTAAANTSPFGQPVAPAAGGPGLFDISAGGLFDEPRVSTEPPQEEEEVFSSAPSIPMVDAGIFDPKSAMPDSPLSDQVGRMTAERSDNSVLFSLKNLQTLAANPLSPLGQSPTAGPLASSEMSGLIDIRSLASALKSDKTGPGMDDFLTLGGSFGSTLGAPVLQPHHSGYSMSLKVGVLAGAALFIGVLVLVLVLLFKSSDPERDEQIALLQQQLADFAKKGGSDDPVMVEELRAKIAREQEAKALEEGDQAAADKAKTEREAAEKKKAAVANKGKSKGTTGTAPRAPGAVAAVAPDISSPKPRASAASSELDDLLGGKPAKKPVAAKPVESSSGGGGGGKQGLGRQDVIDGMGSVAGKVKACAQGQTGSVQLKVVIAPSGRVVSASPTGSFSGTPVGTCAARAVQGARFAKFEGPNVTVAYPFKL